MPDIDYNSALLTVICGGNICFMIWSVKQFTSLQLALRDHAINSLKQFSKFEKHMTKKMAKANAEGAKLVREHFDELMKEKTSG